MAFFNCSGVNLKPELSSVSIITGIPCAIVTIGGYETQYGAGMMTSSPGFTTDIIELYTHCFAPLETMISFIL